jgi:hypothetical protein
VQRLRPQNGFDGSSSAARWLACVAPGRIRVVYVAKITIVIDKH